MMQRKAGRVREDSTRNLLASPESKIGFTGHREFLGERLERLALFRGPGPCPRRCAEFNTGRLRQKLRARYEAILNCASSRLAVNVAIKDRL
jgi:hypothetical protein